MHSVTSSAFGSGVTTVNITGTIDSGLSAVQYSFITPESSPDRFTSLATDDIDVSDAVTADRLFIGSINSVSSASYWNNINNTVVASSGNTIVTFNNGLKFYTGSFNVVVANGETVGYKSGTHTFDTAFSDYNFVTVACFGNGAQGAGTVSLAVTSKSTSGFGYIVNFVTNVTGPLTINVIYIAMGS
jgi:hypothetical protein